MKKKRIAQTAKLFFDYGYKGDGKYHTTEQGRRHYRNITFEAFRIWNEDCLKVLSRGNDAPRGGRTGDYLIVEFTPKFTERYGWYFEAKKELARIAAEKAEKIAEEIAVIGDQGELLRRVFSERPDRLSRIIEAIETRPSSSTRSGDWRSFVRMKAAKWVANGKFELLTLSAPEIRDIKYSF